MNDKIREIIKESVAVKTRVLEDPKLIGLVDRIVTLIVERFREGKHLYFCGNGGSAADVADFTTEYTCRFINDRHPYPAINLTADGSLLTATGNDYGYEEIFARQVCAFRSEEHTSELQSQ